MSHSKTASIPALSPSNVDATKLLGDQLGRLLDLYKHHFDLFLKALAGYLAVLGFIGSSLCGSVATQETRIVLSSLISVASLGGIAGAVISIKWVRALRARMLKICQLLGVEEPPLQSAEHIVTGALCVFVLFLIGGIVYAVHISRVAVAVQK
jgi:hypothetical protein